MKSKYVAIFLLLVFSIVFIDLPLKNYVGTIGRSPAIFISTFIILIYIYFEKKIKVNREVYLFGGYALVTIFTSLIMLIYVYLKYNTFSIYGEDFFVKTIKGSMYNTIFFFMYYVLWRVSKKMSIDLILKIIFYTYVFLNIVAIIEYLNPDILLIIRTKIELSRMRLLTEEPSQAFPLYTFFFIITFFYFKYKNKPWKYYILASVFYFFFSIRILSKGGLIILFLSIVITIFSGKKIKYKFIIKLLKIMPIIIGMLYIIIYLVVGRIMRDIEMFTSVSTRGATAIASILSLVYYPIGEGYGTYVFLFRDLLNKSMEIIYNLFDTLFNIKLNLIELKGMIETGENLTVKSGILFQIVLNGYIAVIFYILVFWNLLKKVKKIKIEKNKKEILKVGIYFIILEFLFATNTETSYYFLLILIIVEKIHSNENKEIILKNGEKNENIMDYK